MGSPALQMREGPTVGDMWATLTGVATGLCVGLIGMALTRVPRSQVRAPLFGLIAAGVVWVVGGEIAACTTSDTAGRRIGVILLYSGVIALPALRFVVSLDWARQVDPAFPLRARGWTSGPFTWATLLWLGLMTNPWHGRLLTSRSDGGLDPGPLWLAMALPAVLLVAGALAIEVRVRRGTAMRHLRRQSTLLIAASVVTLVGGLGRASGLVPIDLTPLVLGVAGALLCLGIAREGILGVIPAALPAIVEEHPDGLVVTGSDGYMRYANARARELLAPIGLRLDVPFATLLRDVRLHPDTPVDLVQASDQTWWNVLAGLHGVPFRLDAEQPRWLHLSARALRGRRGRIRGYWLRISDKTDEPKPSLPPA
jgi:PAS domain-containing protein